MGFHQQNLVLFHGTIFEALRFLSKFVPSSYDQIFALPMIGYKDILSMRLYVKHTKRRCAKNSAHDICELFLSAFSFYHLQPSILHLIDLSSCHAQPHDAQHDCCPTLECHSHSLKPRCMKYNPDPLVVVLIFLH